MITKGSTHKSYMWVNYFARIRNMKLWIGMCIIHVMCLPFALFSYYFFTNATTIGLVALCGIFFFLLAIAGAAVPMMMFDYLYTKSKTDMAYGLPLTKKERFLSDYLSGLTLYVAPYLLQIIFGVIVYQFALHMKPSAENLQNYRSFDSKYIIWIYCIGFLAMLFYYTLCTFAITCVGNIFEAVINIILSNILIASTLCLLGFVLLTDLYGIDFESTILKMIYRTSPIGGLISVMDFQNMTWNAMFLWMAEYSIFIIIFFILAFFIFMKRKAEDVSKSYVVRSFYYILTALITFQFGAIGYNQNIVVLIIIMTVVFFIIDTIANRGLKHIKRSICHYVIMMVVVVGSIYIVKYTDGFHIIERTTELSNVNSITIEYPGIFGNNLNENSSKVKITDQETLQAILNVHKEILANYSMDPEHPIEKYGNKNSNPNSDYYNIDIDQLNHYINLHIDVKYGIDYDRKYYISYETCKKLLPVELSNELIDAKIDHLAKDIPDNVGIMLTDAFASYGMNLYSSDKVEFLSCMREDMKEVSVEDYLRPKETAKIVAKLSDDTGKYNDIELIVLPSYKRTMDFLEKEKIKINTPYRNLSDYVYLQKPSDSKNSTGKFSSSLSGCSESPGMKYLDKANTQVQQLLQVAQPQYCPESSCYCLVYQQRQMVIPPEYSALAEQVYAMSKEVDLEQ